MLRSRGVMMFLLALVLAAGAAWIANGWMKSRLAVDAHAGMVPVVAASVEIPFGKKVEAADVHLVYMPQESAPPTAFRTVADATGRVATQTIFNGEVLREERVVKYLGGSALAAVIAPEKRAVTVRVNDVIGVAGFLLPGNIVDILASRRAGSNGSAETRTLLQSIKVLAVDQTASPDKDQPVIVRAVTMEMTPKEAEELFKATEEGSVQLTLRNPLDRTEAKVAEAPKPAPAPVRRKAVVPASVTIIKGTQVSIEKL